MQIPALSEAPQIRLLRLAEPNCKKQQAAGPSAFRAALPGRTQPSTKEQEPGTSSQGGLCHHIPTGPPVSPKHAHTCFLWEKPSLCHELEAEEGQVTSPVQILHRHCCRGRFGPIACRECQEEGNGTFLFSGEKHLLWRIK